VQIDSVRKLKAELLASPDVRGLGDEAGWLALGIAPAGGEAKLAVRVESLGGGGGGEEAVARIEERARGEVDVRATGPIRAQQDLQGRVRPLIAGLSVAHIDVTAGTLGAFVTVEGEDGLRILSNNHVLADEDEASAGDAVLQPGPADGGRDPADRIGALERAVALSDTEANLVDAAIAALADVEATVGDYGPLGRLAGVLADPAEADAVAKRGRTTAITRGRVTAFELDGLQVGYTRGTLTFDDQIEIESTGSGAFSGGGDSGSLIVTAEDEPRAVGLLFAGSETGGPTGTGLTFANPIATVLRELRIGLA
jgi:hypothetical protein